MKLLRIRIWFLGYSKKVFLNFNSKYFLSTTNQSVDIFLKRKVEKEITKSLCIHERPCKGVERKEEEWTSVPLKLCSQKKWNKYTSKR